MKKDRSRLLLSYGHILRHAGAIERLRDDMLRSDLVDERLEKLSLDAANLVYAFLIANGNDVSPETRDLRNDVSEAILGALDKHGINAETFRVTSIIPRH